MAGNNRRHGKSRVPTEAMKRNKELRQARHERMQDRMIVRNELLPPRQSALASKHTRVDTWSQYRRDAKRAARKFGINE